MVLVVDDREVTRYVLLRMLKFEGYDAVGVASGMEALSYLETAKPSLVILDFNMPSMDGLSVLAEIRKNARLEKVSVIMFSASDERVKKQAILAGVDAYVVKGSLDWDDLHREIVRLIGIGLSRPQHPDVGKPRSKEIG
jgi:CheY-like chemotaxis protein